MLAPVAQWLEHRPYKAGVDGSNPSRRTMTKPKKIIVQPESANSRLDVFLSTELKISRSQVQKMIAHDQILVNGKLPKKTGGQIKTGNVITCHPEQSEGSLATTTDRDSSPPWADQNDNLKIVAETKDYIVVDKPTGLLSHPTEADEPNAVSKILLKKYPGLKKIGDDPKRPGIVHRLDKDASGLMVVARTQKMFEHLKEQFKNRTVEKEYTILVHYPVARDWEEINFPLARSKPTDRMAAIPQTKKGLAQEEGKQAKTEFWVEKRFVNFTLLKVKIHTGRMHQIRVHMLAYTHPVVGDTLYFNRKLNLKRDKELGRLFLHAARLCFADRNGKCVCFDAPLPEALQQFLFQLR